VGERKDNLYLYLFLVALVLVVVSFYAYFGVKRTLEVYEFDVTFSVEEGNVAFDVDNALLAFGRTSPGGAGITRKVSIVNDYDFPIETRVLFNKEILEFLDAEEEVRVEQGENLTIPISLTIPEGAELGDYSGRARFEIRELS